jgi:hypothetical protein
LQTVGEVLRQEGKPLTLKSAQAVWRAGRFVLGPCSSKLPFDVVKEHLVVPRGAADAAVERDDVLLRVLGLKAHFGKVNVHSFSALTEILPEVPQKKFAVVLRQRAESRRWPAGVGMLQGSHGPLLFLLDHVVGAPPQTRRGPLIAVEESRSNGDFARAFKEAFDRLRRDRPFNMVELAALRQALRSYSREQFDQGLHALRKSREFVLETFEGRHGSLSPEELAAAVREDGRIFAFAARRDNG